MRLVLAILLFFAVKAYAAQPITITPPFTQDVLVKTNHTGLVSYGPVTLAASATQPTYHVTIALDTTDMKDPDKQIFLSMEVSSDGGAIWQRHCYAYFFAASEPKIKERDCTIRADIDQLIRGSINVTTSTGGKTNGHPDPGKEKPATVNTKLTLSIL